MLGQLKDAAMKAKAAVDEKLNPKKEEPKKKEEKEKKPEGLPKLSKEEAEKVARDLREAMKGVGTDEDKLIKDLGKLNSAQAKQVSDSYKTQFDRDLVSDLKSETGGKLEDVLVALARPAALVDAHQLHKAIKGLGSDEDSIIEVVCTRTDAEIKAIAQAFRAEFEAHLRDELAADLGGNLEKAILTVVDAALGAGRATPPDSQIDDDVLRIYKAGEGTVGTNESVFVQILAANQPAYVHKLAHAYGKKHGVSLVLAIKKEFGENKIGRALLALVQPPEEFLGDRLYHAMQGAGTDEHKTIRLIVGNRDERLAKISAYFIHKYEKSVARWVEHEFRGDAKNALLAVCHAHEG